MANKKEEETNNGVEVGDKPKRKDHVYSIASGEVLLPFLPPLFSALTFLNIQNKDIE